MKFSIIIPNYNKEEYINECLDSIYTQTLTQSEFEVIFVDDNSSDNSITIANEYDKYNNFMLLSTDRKGAGGARNKALNNCKGEYVIFLDSDDYLSSPNILENLYNIINDQDIIFLNFIKNTFGDIVTVIDEKNNISEKIESTKLLGCPTKCFKRSIIGDTRFPECRRYEDVNFTLENLCKVKTYDYLDEPFFVYRKVNNSNTTSTVSGTAMTDVFLEISSLYYLCFKYPKYKNEILARIKNDKLHLRLDILDTLIETQENNFRNFF